MYVRGIYHQYESVQALRKFLDNRVNIPSASTGISNPDFQHVEIGYILPGHDLKGKKIWLCTDTDLQDCKERTSGLTSTHKARVVLQVVAAAALIWS